MTMETLKAFFMWCTVLNLGLLVFSAIMCTRAKGLIQRIHGKMFDLKPEAINAFIYGYLGVYKIMFIIFCLVPWIVLCIMT